MSQYANLQSAGGHRLSVFTGDESLPDVTQSTDAVTLSVVMPCLNEELTLGVCIEKIQRTFKENGIRGEVVVADNGSTDCSCLIAESMGARVVHVKEKGYGSALMGGILAARGKYILMGDADDSYDFSHAPRFLEKLEEGYELVMGNRFKGVIEPGAMPIHHRYLGNPVLTGIGRLFFRSPMGDFHCGLRAFRKDSILRLALRTTGMEFASEMVVKAAYCGLKTTEVPTTLKKDGRHRPPHLRSWRDGWRHLRFMLVYSPRWLFLYPGVLLIIVGMALLSWLLPGPRQIGNVTLDIQTAFCSMMAVLIGFQAVLFSILSKFFAINSGLIPEPPGFEKLFRYCNLEVGLMIGFGLVISGVIGFSVAIFYWDNAGFGPLDVSKSLRWVIPSLGAVALGTEIILSSFFLTTLGLIKKEKDINFDFDSSLESSAHDRKAA
jgi:glycosyltransferase involved in cell wall biosynthesis